MKGFDEYLYLDNLIKSKNLQNKLQFTYIGNLPKKNIFQTAKVIKLLW